ncbi:SusC/RagA family TonB-linked outer membrane protein [Spirosoma horti]
MKRIRLLMLSLFCLTFLMAEAQIRKLSGKVLDSQNTGLPGASVLVKGSAVGTATDANGDFSISVPANAVLVVSYTGYLAKEVTVGQSSTLTISLDESPQMLSDVVVVGYGTQRKRDLTGAIASISQAEVKNLPIARADQILQGRISGVQVTQTNAEPGGNISIRIRGTNSINSGNEPLFVIDGFPGAGDLNSINPSDIESMEVLKDASATAIYGSRGANGVVIVTTKKGSTKQSSVNFEAYHGVQTVSKMYEMMNAKEFATYLNDVQTLTNQETPASAKALPYTQDQLSALGEGTNWQKQVLRSAPISNYQLNFLGGNADTRYNLSMNYFNQQGIVINSGFQRGSIRLNLDKKISNKINIGFTSQLTRSVENRALVNTAGSTEAGGVILDAMRFNPALPVYDQTGAYTYLNGPSGYVELVGNPVAYANKVKNQYSNLRGLLNFFGEYEIVKGLKLRSTAGTDFNYSSLDYYLPSDIYGGSNSKGTATRTSGSRYSWVNENTLTYDREFNKSHALTLLGGLTFQEFNFTDFATSNSNFFTNLLESDNIGIGANVLPPSSSRSKNNLMSYFGRANYRFMDKYLFTFTMRADGSSRFGPNNKWGYFPSGAFAWRVIDESFMKSVPVISDLKLRASYGVTGNQEIASYSSFARYTSNAYTLGGSTRVIGLSPNNIPNPDISWESTSSLDFGIDLSVLSNRITLTADYYYKRTKDLLLNVSVPVSSGYSTVLLNAGGVQNKGFELGINSVNINSGRFKWTTAANISANRNKVLDLNGEYERFVGTSSSSIFPSASNGATSLLRIGEPIGAFYGYVFQGIWQTQDEISASKRTGVRPGDPRYADLNGDGLIDAKDRTIIGQAQPKFIYGLTNNFTLGNFNLNVFLQGVQGDNVLNMNRYYLETGGYINGNKLQSQTQRWTGPGTSNTIAKANSTLRRGTGITSDIVEDGSFLRVKTVSLSYTIPKITAISSVVKTANIYVTAQNLLTFTNYSGYDPEVNSFGASNLSLNTDLNAYPNVRTFTAGIRLGL